MQNTFSEPSDMGAGSTCHSVECVATFENVMPSYYLNDFAVSNDDVVLAKESWRLILNDAAPEYVRLLSENEYALNVSCLVWFYDSFYERLFEVHPSSRSQFQGSLKKQGLVLVKIIGISIGLRDDEARVTKILVQIAKVRNSECFLNFSKTNNFH